MVSRIDVQALGWQSIAHGRKQDFDLIPTWQVGQRQPQDADYQNLIEEGYSKHAVIHACISILSSSAALPPLHLFRGEDEITTHRLLSLIERPNEWQSETEFRELLLTHLLVTGNAYVELVRGGELVRQMGLLRPDRVEIKPGRSREDDVYVYTVSGVQKRAIEQRDIIHFRLPNPRNDFYGLSPIVVAAREANLDIDLTLFTRAFFDNAGVPFGILSVPGHTGKDEKEEIKSAWRRAFNRATGGVRKFFELLVLNADEAKYQQLGLPIKDLEMKETRNQTESRMCMSFRVPPIMVAAMVGLEHATYANFEAAEKVLWRYGVAYYLGIVRDRLNLELIPEFRGSTDSRLRLEYDLSAVPALAEDNTEKLNAVANLLKTGGFTTNQALQLVGLNAVEGGDIYVRQLTQVVEVPLNGGGKAVLIEGKAESKQRAARGLASVIQAIRSRIESRMVPDLRAFFDDQAAEVAKRIRAMEGATTIREGDIFPDGQDEALLNALRPHVVALAESLLTALDDELGKSAKQESPIIALLLQRAAERVVAINEFTRVAIRDVLALAEERGYSLFHIVNGVEADGFPGLRSVVEETYHNRAEAVARTEAGNASNDAALARYAEAGITEVELIDGTDDDCCADRNGTRVAVADRPELCHPNCTLVVVPVVE